jgi:alkylation response protein AidB-like acyl-CoA dehydrogenase
VDFEFSDDQELLRDSVRRYLTDRAPLPWVRAHYDDDAVVDDVWRGLAEIGLTAMLVPESSGGAGMGMVDLALPLGEMGRWVYPGPFAASAVGAASFLSAVGTLSVADEWLPRIADGTAVATLATTPARDDAVRCDGGSLHGTVTHVPDGVAADLVLVAVDADTVIALPTSESAVDVASLPTVDGSRKFATVTCSGATGTELTGVGAALAAASDRLALAFVLDGVGAAEVALELAVEYAKEREQFGKPIGSFQAVQHLCADMLRAVELGTPPGGDDGAGVRGRRLLPGRRDRDPGVRRRRLHVGARHPPLLQAPAHAAAPGRVGERSPGGAGDPRPALSRGATIAAMAHAASTTMTGSAGTRNRVWP